MSTLTPLERQQYDRHLRLPQIGLTGQLQLKAARVLVIGAGGLSATLVPYLAAAGVGSIGIVDFDRIERSNLQRQILYLPGDIGQLKVEVLAQHLHRHHPHCALQSYAYRLDLSRALVLFPQYDYIVDATDNFATRYLINDVAVYCQKTLVFGAIHQFDGQIAVLNAPLGSGKHSPNYRDLYPIPPSHEAYPNCAEAGVLGVLPGIIGGMQANELIKLICHIDSPLIGKLFCFDTLQMHGKVFAFFENPENPLRHQDFYPQDYRETSQCSSASTYAIIDASHVTDLASLTATYTLLDVRTKAEFEGCPTLGRLLPINELPQQIHRLDKTAKWLVLCQSGTRSAQACQLLSEHGFSQVTNLQGGLAQLKSI